VIFNTITLIQPIALLPTINHLTASELPNLSSVEYSINIDSIVLYRPLYNLLET
jgi:hypothetical protein